MQGSDGNYYGTTVNGGSFNGGTVFKITAGGALTTLYNFDPFVGYVAHGAHLSKPATATSMGRPNIQGVLRRWLYLQWGRGRISNYTLWFRDRDKRLPIQAIPWGGLVQATDGNLYGVTQNGGVQNNGALFQVTLAGAEAVLCNFDTNPDGNGPSGIIRGADGNFYGATTNGGAYGYGTVFRSTSVGAVTTLHSFGALDGSSHNADGSGGKSALVQASDGNFYGVATQGGTLGGGTVYQMTSAGAFTTLYDFGSVSGDGSSPVAPLVQGSDGKFYGTTEFGGARNIGTAFRITSVGSLTTLYTFGMTANDAGNPTAALFQATDGNFYGTTAGGGAVDANSYSGAKGTVFKMTPAGAENVLFNFFSQPNDGYSPQAALLQGSDGNFYGTANSGGSQYAGCAFKVTPAGLLTKIYDFNTVSGDGFYPSSALLKGADGNFYGTASAGGSLGGGTIFVVSPAGGEATLYNIPYGSGAVTLLQESEGTLYGTTSTGGDAGVGSIFQLSLASAPPAANNVEVVLSGASPVVIDVLAYDFDPNGQPLTLTAVGEPSIGRATVNANNTITYTPNQPFAKYSGLDTFTYTISNGQGGTATAKVNIANSFYQQKGPYQGALVSGGGYLTLALANNGAFTGKLRVGSIFYTLKGQFDANGDYSATVNGQLLTLQMNVGPFPTHAYGSYTIAGSYGGDPLTAYHAIYNSPSNPAPEAGNYTVLLPGANTTSAAIPAGTGFAIVKVKESGAATIAGVLADGTPISDGVYLTGSGTPNVNSMPVYISLAYKTERNPLGQPQLRR